MENKPSENPDADQPLTPQQFIEQMGTVDISSDDLNLIFEIGLREEMEPYDIFKFAKKSKVGKELKNCESYRNLIKERLMSHTALDDVDIRAKRTEESLNGPLLMMHLQSTKSLKKWSRWN